MAIELHSWNAIKRQSPGEFLSLSYPDLLVPESELPSGLPLVPNQEAVQRRHGWPWKIFESDDALRALGFTPTYIDRIKERSFVKVVDLNTDIGNDYYYSLEGGCGCGCDGPEATKKLTRRWFNIVLDPGTSEHIFNIGNVFHRIHHALAEGGVVIHTNPCTMVNHGFWNLNPGTYVDIYDHLGYKIEELALLHGPLANRQRWDILDRPFDRYQVAPETTLLCVARKLKHATFSWPTQRKYQNAI